MSKSLKDLIDNMNNNLDQVEAKKEAKRFKKYSGTPVISEHGMMNDVPVEAPKQIKKFKGTIGFAGIGKHSLKKDGLNEDVQTKTENPTEKTFNHIGEWTNTHDNKHLGPHKTAVQYSLQAKYPFEKNPHAKAHRQYSADSENLNHHLYQTYNKGETPQATVQTHNINHLDKAMNHNTLKHDLHVYSGVGFHPGEEATKNKENKLHLPAFTSTSIDKSVAHSFARRKNESGKLVPENDGDDIHHKHILHVHLKTGQKGSYIGNHSIHENEHEFTLPRHTTLKIRQKPDIYHSKEHGGKRILHTHVWHAHVVPNEEER